MELKGVGSSREMLGWWRWLDDRKRKGAGLEEVTVVTKCKADKIWERRFMEVTNVFTWG